MAKTSAQTSEGIELQESAQLARIEDAAAKYSLTTIAALPRFQQALTLARGIAEIRALLRPLMPQFMPLVGSKLGFKADRPSDKLPAYTQDQVCDVLIEATLRGLRPVGNEINIISGQCYTTKEGFTRLLRELPGLTDLKMTFGVPNAKSGGAVVPCSARWRYQGKPDSIECDIPIRTNAGSGVDQILGKAERKLRARIWNQVTGSEQSDGDVEEAVLAALPASKTEEVLRTLRDRAANGDTPPVKTATGEQLERISRMADMLSISSDAIAEHCREQGANPELLNEVQAGEVIAWLEAQEPQPA